MDKLKMHSPNGVDANINRIRELFPNCVTEARDEQGNLKLAVDFDLLRQELSASIVEGPQERYQLNWPGKREALLAANAPIARTLRPCREESVDFDTTRNLFIEGDNLEALKLLQETYLGKIKLIYIDPPYNTGKDFIYDDDFRQNVDDYLLKTGQIDASGTRMQANTEANGRFHSDWLSMMYSRLRLARNLLKDDGVIFVSIDDNEVHNAISTLNEIFGENNHISTVVWKRKRGKDNSAPFISRSHEYLMVYAKDISKSSIGRLEMSKETESAYSNPDLDPRGDYRIVAAWATGQKSGSTYDVTFGNIAIPERKWVYSKQTLLSYWNDKRLVLKGKNSSDNQPNVYLKVFKSENRGQVPDSIWADTGNAADGADQIKDLFDGRLVFSTIKPLQLINRITSIASNHNDIVMDFFAG